jgi:hypothetical protein
MFREDEMKLQEHYSSEFAKSQPRREIDIHASLVSHVTLPHGKSMNVKEFNIEQEFEGLRNLHREYYESDMEATIRQVREKQEREQRQQRQQQQHQQDPHEIPWAEWVAAGEASETCIGCNDLECSDCYDDDHDGNGDGDSYDSDYCGVFGHYPREYEHERETREAEEARAAAEAAEEAARRRREEEMSIEAEEEEAEEEDAEEVEPTYDDDIPSVEPKERHASSSAFTATTNVISAQKKAAAGAAAKAAKARIAKQQQKKQQKKFVPVQVTDNTNRTNEVTAILTANKLEVNLPKKNLQNASREAVKRHNQKWNRVNALAKQSGARGTKIATLPDPRPWYNNSTCYGYESD